MSSLHSIRVLKLEGTRATAGILFFFIFTDLDAMFVDILLRNLVRDFA